MEKYSSYNATELQQVLPIHLYMYNKIKHRLKDNITT